MEMNPDEEAEFLESFGRPSLMKEVEGSLRDINAALSDMQTGGRGWRPSMVKQMSQRMGTRSGSGTLLTSVDETPERASKMLPRFSDVSHLQVDDSSLNSLQKELEDIQSAFNESRNNLQEEDEDSLPSVVAGSVGSGFLKDFNLDVSGHQENKSRDSNGNFIDSSEANAEQTIPTSILVSSDPDKANVDGNATSATEDSATPSPSHGEKEQDQEEEEDGVTERQYEMGIQNVKLRAMEEKLSTEQQKSQRVLQVKEEEIQDKSQENAELQEKLAEMEKQYEELMAEKANLRELNKIQQEAIMEMQRQRSARWF